MANPCIECHQHKPLSEFYRHPRMANGTVNVCKECHKARMRRRQQDHPEKIKPQSPEHISWWQMRSRCNNPKDTNYKRYGGRGIKICERWQSFQNFLDDMGPRPSPQHSINRVNNNGNYEPGNCQWSTPKEQANNRRSSRIIEHEGRCRTLEQWAETAGIQTGTLHYRLKRRWPMSAALSRQDHRFPENYRVKPRSPQSNDRRRDSGTASPAVAAPPGGSS
jgi:hypothetical protein